MITLDDVHALAPGTCPQCGRDQDACAISMMQRELDGFAALPAPLERDAHYPTFYRRFADAVARANARHTRGVQADRDALVRCFNVGLFGEDYGGPGAPEGLGATWHREPAEAGRDEFSTVPKKPLDFRVDAPTHTVFIEFKSNYSFDEIGAAYREALRQRQAHDGATRAVFYFMTLHCGRLQAEYDRCRRQFEVLSQYVCSRGDLDMRHVNLLPFYGNEDSILELLATIRS